jgi:hypothetical protein
LHQLTVVDSAEWNPVRRDDGDQNGTKHRYEEERKQRNQRQSRARSL